MTNKTVYANLAISEPVYTRFREICDEQGWKYCKQVEKLMGAFNKRNGMNNPYTTEE